ncbi:MAG TPA: hypothetical protein VGB26_07945 [Nitrospiria bacterium]
MKILFSWLCLLLILLVPFAQEGTSTVFAETHENSEEMKNLEKARKWVKTDPTGRFILPVSQEETNKAMKILIQGLDAESSEVVLISVCLIKNLMKENKIPDEPLLQEIKKRMPPLTVGKASSRKFCANGVLWWNKFNSLQSQEERIQFLEESLKKSPDPVSSQTGYDWDDGLEILIIIGTDGALKVIERLLSHEFSKGKEIDENIIQGLELSIKRFNENLKLKDLKGQERIDELNNLIMDYGKTRFLNINSTKSSSAFPVRVLDSFMKDLIRELADEQRKMSNEAFKEIWNSEENIRLKWMIEDILLERNIITPDMKKVSRPIE